MITTEFKIDINAFSDEEQVLGAVKAILDLNSNNRLMEVLIKGSEGDEFQFLLNGVVVVLRGNECE